MKRLYVALGLIFIAIFICVFSSISVEKKSVLLQRELSEIGQVISSGEAEKAKQLLSASEKKRAEAETLFSFIVDADKIEELNIGFRMIEAHLNDGNTEHALERLRECVLMLEEITANEKLNIKNIM